MCTRFGTLDFKGKLGFRRHVGHELSGEKLFAFGHHRVLDVGFVHFCAEQNTDCRIIPFRLLERVKHTAIGIHLANVTARQLRGFQVDEDETLENVIIKDEINKFFRSFCRNADLAANKREALAEFKKKRFNIAENAGFDRLLLALEIPRPIEEFGDARIFEKHVWGR